MPRSEKAKAAFARAKDSAPIKPATVIAAMEQARAAIRDAMMGLHELRFDLSSVDDQEDRAAGVEAMLGQVKGGIERGDRLLDQFDAFVRTLSEIERDAPKFEARLNE